MNLVNASRVFMMDLWWNASVEEQAMDRVHRLGLTTPSSLSLSLSLSLSSRHITLVVSLSSIVINTVVLVVTATHRTAGQTRDVKVVRYVCEGSLESCILDIQARKSALAAGTTRKLNADEMQKVRLADLKQLFSEKADL